MSPPWKRGRTSDAVVSSAGLDFEQNEEAFEETRDEIADVRADAPPAVAGVPTATPSEPRPLLSEDGDGHPAPLHVEVTDADVASEAPTPLWRQMLRVYISNRLAVLSTVVLAIIVGGCFFGPWFYHTNQTDAYAVLFSKPNLPPSAAHPLGTDATGWDVLGRIMFAGRYSLTLGVFAGLITIVIGTLYGMISGFFGGVLDAVLMRLIDTFLSIPYLFLLITIVVIFGNSTTLLILVIGLTGWWGNARIIRGDALYIRDLEYSQAASAMGSTRLHIIRRHVYPNSMGNIVTVGTFSIADSILALSALGFLGLGIPLPATDWGTMLNTGVEQLFNGFWWQVYPVTAVFVITIVCVNYMGDALRDIFEVRLRER